VLILLRYIYNLGRKWRVAAHEGEPDRRLSTAPDVQRDRFLTPEESQRLIASIEADENQIAAQAIMLLLLTGARRNGDHPGEVGLCRLDAAHPAGPAYPSPASHARSPSTPRRSLCCARSRARDDNPTSSLPGQRQVPSASLFFPWDRIRKRRGAEGRATA